LKKPIPGRRGQNRTPNLAGGGGNSEIAIISYKYRPLSTCTHKKNTSNTGEKINQIIGIDFTTVGDHDYQL
jgi:hypothetical protein